MASNKPSYILLELEWLENEVRKLQEDINSYERPLKDRVELKQTKTGGVIPMVISSKEEQMKAITFILEKLPRMFQSLSELRQKADSAKFRNDDEMPDIMGG